MQVLLEEGCGEQLGVGGGGGGGDTCLRSEEWKAPHPIQCRPDVAGAARCLLRLSLLCALCRQG